MKIGVLDSDGYFSDIFFADKKIIVLRDSVNIAKIDDVEINGFTHGELVCSFILKENPSAEIILIPIINKGKCSVLSMLKGMQKLMDANVDIINLSIGDEYKFHKELECLCYEAWKRGILIVAAHSNNAVRATYPASFPFVLGVRCINDEMTDDIMKYNEEDNDVIFSLGGFSVYHLGVPRFISGNSLGCAKIVGLLSRQKDYFGLLKKFIESRINSFYPYKSLKKKRCIFLTNRITEPMEQIYIQEITNSVAIISFEKGLDRLETGEMESDFCDAVFIDHNEFKELLSYKTRIKHLILTSSKEIVIRYPLFSLFEKLEFYKNEQVGINQLYI